VRFLLERAALLLYNDMSSLPVKAAGTQ
jgi:hypothetical protein